MSNNNMSNNKMSNNVEELRKLYVDADFLMVGSIELLGNLINDGLKPQFAHRKRSNNHWTFAFRTNNELKTILMKYSGQYNIIYRETVYGEENETKNKTENGAENETKNKVPEDGIGELRDLDEAASKVLPEA